ncbi:mitochondrial fission ELM1 family protein [Lysobacter sp. Root494]|uniref:mitochondrial fission ELM1 family protein n=1 Tax=Lysobacter sp. Root494 TaxID=1736549 RepID=UPI0007014574|nr:mitochondrial fission ELM1 family protein [Lysobacter sp. Root494]KQY50334.1 nucleoside-diphosphate sugar epimerase [Lysobacter sp. Root494]
MQQSTRPHPDAWTLSDGHAGNVRQVQALAQAMALPDVHDWTLHARAPWRWLSPRWLPVAGRAFGEGFARAMDMPPHVAIGCGRQAALATRLLRQRGTRAVQILDPRIATRHWDVVVAPEHDGLRGPNVITLLGSLHPVDDLWLAAARQQFVSLAQLPQPRTAVLVGGASAHAAFDIESMSRWLDALAARIADEGGSVLATASRRTPEAARDLLRAALGKLPGVVWCDERDGANPYGGLLGWADRIVCTADSVNMLSEAAATNVSMFVAGIDGLGGRPRRFVDSLLAVGRVHAFDDALAPFAVTPLRETARVAGEVRARLML